MKKCIIILIIQCFFSLCPAQTTNTIIGKWKFKELYNTQGMDSIGKQMLEGMFGEMTIYLKENKQYQSELMKKDDGTYEYDKATKKIVLTSNKGTQSELEINVLTNETILLSFGKDKSIVLIRDNSKSEEDITPVLFRPVLISITESQLCKKWYLKERYLPNRTAEQSKAVTELFEGTYFLFKQDHSFEAGIGKLTETGTWSLQNNNQTLYLATYNETKFWNIKKITENEIELFRGHTEEFWTFSTKK